MSGKKNKEKRKLEAEQQQQLAVQKPGDTGLKKYWKQISAVVLGIAGVGIGIYQSQKTRSDTQENSYIPREQTSPANKTIDEKALYGDLYQYKNDLSKYMLGKAQNGEYFYEEFLPKLKESGSKLLIKVYMGEPPVREGDMISLSPVPEDMKGHIKASLDKWGEFFTFVYVDDPKKADINVYAESKDVKNISAGAVNINSSTSKALGWTAKDIKIAGEAILIDANSFDIMRRNMNILSNSIMHEGGHKFFGLIHFEDALSMAQNNGKDIYVTMTNDVAREELTKVIKQHPQLRNLTIMTSVAFSDEIVGKPGPVETEAARMAMKLLKQKYSPKSEIIQRDNKTKKALKELNGQLK